jgi:hypothetical protein
MEKIEQDEDEKVIRFELPDQEETSEDEISGFQTSRFRFTYFYLDPMIYVDRSYPRELVWPDAVWCMQQKNLKDNPSSKFREKFEDGEEEAIFEYVKSDHQSFQAVWVVNQIEKWRTTNSEETIEKLRMLFKSYLGETRGQRTSLTRLNEIIKKDQEIYSKIVDLIKENPEIPVFGVTLEKSVILLVLEWLCPMEGQEENLEYIDLMERKRGNVEMVYKEYTKVAKDLIQQKKFNNEEEFIDYFIDRTFLEIIKDYRVIDQELAIDLRASTAEDDIVPRYKLPSKD